jgi:RNA polymerase sigma factor (sigma-70 family)
MLVGLRTWSWIFFQDGETLGASARSSCMKASAAGRAAVWSTAISVSAIDPHAAFVALGAAAVKEAFELAHARSQRTSVLAYLRACGARTYLSIDQSPATPALVLSVASPASRPGDEEGADPVPPGREFLSDGFSPDPGEFCIKQREDWLAYAAAWTRNWPDAEDAVSHVVQKILEHHARHGTLCPDARDPVGWSKTVIRNYLIDRTRRLEVQRRRSGALMPPAGDVADDVTDRIIARKALDFVDSLESQAHTIAMMRWVDGLAPKEIADRLGMNPRSVRTSLHRTRKKMRARLGVAEPEKILREETA